MDDLKIIQSVECLNACLVNYLNMCGKNMKSSIIYWWGEGFNFKYSEHEGRYRLLSDMFKSNFYYMDKVGIQYNHDFYKDKYDELDFLVQLLKQGRKICIKIRTDYLKYNRVYSQTISMHYIYIMAYNREQRELFIVDGDVPTTIPSCFSGWVKESEIIDGWIKTKCEYIEFVNCNRMSLLFQNELVECIKKQLFRYCNPKSEDTGICAISTYFERLYTADMSVAAEIAMDMNYQIKVEGIWASRQYLLEILQLLHAEETIQELNEIIKQWNIVCMSLIKFSISKREKDRQTLLSMISSILEREKIFFSNLVNILTNIQEKKVIED